MIISAASLALINAYSLTLNDSLKLNKQNQQNKQNKKKKINKINLISKINKINKTKYKLNK
jgi:hypothetical protein